ncbi:hypothetical protein [Veronia pacifica]|uniref:Undecaprenyl-phosphate alpha-N-acetylglucosaminyl 1-phosphate transferase n=1 Tax=Veronia pacifica TaxID=1080227 RepID=A0A1C3ER71_9GAMM|nr:hypothetical protein [Veronia pacifica]ODA35755.1 hypothetical protein A8L45_01570 [Veronia pacifica]
MAALFSLFLTFLALTFLPLKRFADEYGLLDVPDGRKDHMYPTPQVGGILVIMSVLITAAVFPNIYEKHLILLLCLAVVSMLGVADDRLDLDYRIRLIGVTGLAIIMMLSGIGLNSLGDLFGTGPVHLGITSIFVTVCAVLGCVNAFNMIDGIDGLLSAVSSVTLLSLAYLFQQQENIEHTQICLIVFMALVPCFLFNIGAFGAVRRIFMGDSGSMFLGFLIVWMLVEGSGNELKAFNATTALWLIAVPLMDMAAVITGRCVNKKLPFSASKDHIHHILLKQGLSNLQVLFFVTLLSSIMAIVGILLDVNNVSDSVSFSLFLILFVLYLAIFRIESVIKNIIN